MNTILEQITEWLKGMLIDGIMNNLSGMFDAVNQQVGDVAAQVGRSPSAFSPGVFSMVRNVSESVIIPIRSLVQTHENDDFILHVGVKVLIKRKKFEYFIDRSSEV